MSVNCKGRITFEQLAPLAWAVNLDFTLEGLRGRETTFAFGSAKNEASPRLLSRFMEDLFYLTGEDHCYVSLGPGLSFRISDDVKNVVDTETAHFSPMSRFITYVHGTDKLDEHSIGRAYASNDKDRG